MRIFLGVALIFGLAGCQSALELSRSELTPINLTELPFSRVSGAVSFPPFVQGWQSGAPEGEVVHRLNGYRMYVAETELTHPGWDLAEVSVQPNDWPCAFVFVGRQPSERYGPLYEIAFAGTVNFTAATPAGGGAFMSVITVFRPLQPVLQDQMRACRETLSDSDCAERIAARYTGQGVVFEAVVPHPTRENTALSYTFLMRDGLLSVHR